MSNPTSYVICHACKQPVVMTDIVNINYILEDGSVVRGHECKSCAHGDPEETHRFCRECENIAVEGRYYCHYCLENGETK